MGRQEAAANATLLYAPVVIGLLVTVVGVNVSRGPLALARLALGCFGAGFALFLLAKASLLRQGTRLSFGSPGCRPGTGARTAPATR